MLLTKRQPKYSMDIRQAIDIITEAEACYRKIIFEDPESRDLLLAILKKHVRPNAGVSMSVVQERAQALANELLVNDFQASVVQLSAFKGVVDPNVEALWGVKPMYWTHYVVSTNGMAIDLCRKKIDSSARSLDLRKLETLKDEWSEIRSDPQWFPRRRAA